MNEKLLLSVMEKFDESDVVELELNEGNLHLVLRKEAAVSRPVQISDGAAAPVASAPAAQAPAQSVAKDSGSQVHLGMPAAASGHETITSPIVGTFYSSPGPDAPVFVQVGSKVKAGDKLCILEAMKMMNHLEAEFDCEIVSILASSGDMVEYGQALFEVKR